MVLNRFLSWGYPESLGLRQLSLNNLAHVGLLFFNGKRGVDRREVEFRDHALVLFQNLALKNVKALLRVFMQPQIHAGLIELYAAPPHQDALHGNLEGDAKIECGRGLDGEAVKLPNPLAI